MQLDELYPALWAGHGEAGLEVLDRSLGPRSPELLYERAAGLGLDRSWRVLDAGCGRGRHSVELATRFDCHVEGVDPVAANLELAAAAAAEAGVSRKLAFTKGGLEALPFADARFELVWCRDVLVHVADVETALAECARVLRPGGHLLLYTTVATPELEPREAAQICAALAVQRATLDAARIDAAVAAAGLRTVEAALLGSEFAEHFEERDGSLSRELLRVARMGRDRERIEAALGPVRYAALLGLYRWWLYHLLGKLSSAVYVLERP